MQCVNCQFNNMPGTQTCARCGSSLTLSTSTIDVHPPRAGTVALKFRRVLPVHQWRFTLRDRWARASSMTLPALTGHVPETAVLIRLVIPGWAHFRVGQRWQGHALLWPWLTLMLIGLLYFGTAGGNMLLGLAFSIHSFAASDLINRASQDRGVAAQMARSIVISILLAICIYGPAAYVLTRFANAVTPQYAIGPFASGDTLLVNQFSTPTRGSVVLYEMPPYRGTPQAPLGHTRIAGYSGQRIDRILAIAGDRVECRRGVLLINDSVSEQAPLVHVKYPEVTPFVVPEGAVLIIPSTTKDLAFATESGLFREMSVVSIADIQGIVYARLHPFTKFRLIY